MTSRTCIYVYYVHRELTVAGPIILTPFCLAVLINFLVRFSGIPSAMMETVRNWMKTRKRSIESTKNHPQMYLPEGVSEHQELTHMLSEEKQS